MRLAFKETGQEEITCLNLFDLYLRFVEYLSALLSTSSPPDPETQACVAIIALSATAESHLWKMNVCRGDVE